MTNEELKGLFKKHEGEYLKFDRIERKRSNRPDIHAFLLLDELVPGKGDMVNSAGHDEIFLEPDVEDMACATEEEIVELIRCGVRLSREYGCLAMFV